MDGKVFTKETKDLIVKAVSDVVKEKVPFYLKLFIPAAVRIIVNFIDTKADKFIPDSIDSLLNDSIIAGFNGDYQTASVKSGTALNILIDVPLLEEDSEQVMFVEGVKFLIGAVRDWIEKRK